MNLSEYIRLIKNNIIITEGGASGHLAHITDYTDMTLDDLKALLYSLFNGQIEDITEKIDGTNIQAGMNGDGEVIFIRNNGDLQSERGGMSVEDMARKWAGNTHTQKVFVESGKILEKVFSKLGADFFNPDENTRIFCNCECMTEGTTNIMPYVSSKVFIHDLWIYEKDEEGKWRHTETSKEDLPDIDAILDKADGAEVTPLVAIRATKESRAALNSFFEELSAAWAKYDLGQKDTIEDYKRKRFDAYCTEHEDWIYDADGVQALFERIVNDNKSYRINDLKKLYKDNPDDLKRVDADAKKIRDWVGEDLDDIMLRIGNKVLRICHGFVNSNNADEIDNILRDNLRQTIKDIEDTGDEDTINKLFRQLKRLGKEPLNPEEGIVFRYNGRIMKVTGSFAPLNQILGSLKYKK